MDLRNYPNYEHFKGQKILSIDYGTKITGLAEFTPDSDPYPLRGGRVIYESDEQLIEELIQRVNDEFFEIIVIGLPHHKDGSPSDQTKKVQNFAHEFKAKVPDLIFFFQDETLSTREAKERMQNSPEFNFKIDYQKLDEVSAVIILEDFIRSENPIKF